MGKTAYCYYCMHPLPADGDACPQCGRSGYPHTQAHQLLPGTLLKDRYVTGRVLGEGGFGITYLGLDTLLNARVAIKEYYPHAHIVRDVTKSKLFSARAGESEKLIEDEKQRFLEEARTMARLEDVPGVVNTKDYFEENETAYIIMEYLGGLDLGALIEERTFSVEATFQLMAPIMDALVEMHARGMIHRDVSPQNIKVLEDGSLKLMDFGSARVVSQEGDETMTAVVKAGYTPVEQYSSRGRQGPWTDIYALAATMYKCITGVTPASSLDRMSSDADPIVWPSQMGIGISKRQEAALMKAMAIKERDRFQSIDEMRSFIETRRLPGLPLAAPAPRLGLGALVCFAFTVEGTAAADGALVLAAPVLACLVLMCAFLYRRGDYGTLGFCVTCGVLLIVGSLVYRRVMVAGVFIVAGMLLVAAARSLVRVTRRIMAREDEDET